MKSQTQELKKIKQFIKNQNEMLVNYFEKLNTHITKHNSDEFLYNFHQSNEKLVHAIDSLNQQLNQNNQNYSRNNDLNLNNIQNEQSIKKENHHSTNQINKERQEFNQKQKEPTKFYNQSHHNEHYKYQQQQQRNKKNEYKKDFNINQQWISETRKMYALEREIQLQNQKYGIISHNCLTLNSSPNTPSPYSTTMI